MPTNPREIGRQHTVQPGKNIGFSLIQETRRSPAAMVNQVEKESLEQEVDHIVEESRMVLPGIQALFGFQLIAVFSEKFAEMPQIGRNVHLVAIVLITISIALIMAPAAYHRQTERGSVSRYLANYSSWLITVAMLPLLVAIAFEVGLVAYAILASVTISALCGGLIAALFLWLWFIYPAIRRSRHGSGLNKPAS